MIPQTPELTGIAKELQDMIIANVSRHDLLAVRATSHQLEGRANERFLKEYFTTRTHLVTRHSLRCLEAISLNPQWAGMLKEVQLTFCKIDLPDRSQPPPVDPDELAHFNNIGGRTRAAVIDDRETSALFGTATYPEGFDVRLLTRFLGNLKRGGHRVAITVGPDFFGLLSPTPVFGFQTYQRLLGCRIQLCHADDIYHGIVRSLFTAAAAARYKFYDLKLFPGDCSRDILKSSIQIPSRLLDPLRTSWSTLTRLTLGQFRDDWYRKRKDPLKKLVSSATQLEEFVLEGARKERPTLWYWVQALKTTRLMKLRLSMVQGRKRNFVQLIGKHRTTLSHVYMQFCVIDDADCWLDILEFMARELNLRYLQVGCMMYAPSRDYLMLDGNLLYLMNTSSITALARLDEIRRNNYYREKVKPQLSLEDFVAMSRKRWCGGGAWP